MCLRLDVNPSLQCIEKERAIVTAQWAVDQRPFVWSSASKPEEKPQTQSRPLWTAWTDTFCSGAALPYARIITKAGGSDESFEGDSLSSGYCLRASPTSPPPREIEALQTKNAGALKPKLRSGRTSAGKTSTGPDHKARHCDNRPAASKKEISTPGEDVSMSLSVADSEDPSDDEEEAGRGVSEKRRKRMLSNRASAQRSRHRRQERLDTLEVLVAELRVEKAALTRKANNSTTAAKKSEDENKTLRDLLREHAPVPLSDSNASNESDKTTENSTVAVHNQNRSSWNDLSSRIEETRTDNSLSRARSGALKRECGEEPVENSTPWKRNFSNSNFDFDFNSDLMESAPYRETFSRTGLPENSGGVNMKDVEQSAMTSLAQNHSLQGGNSFGNDLEQCYLEMDKTDLESRSVEDMWLDGLGNSLK